MQGVRDAWLRDCSFQGPPGRGLSRFSGGYGEGETPLPIPNRAVKPLSADGTWLARARESRTPPVYMQSRAALPGRLVAFKDTSQNALHRQNTASRRRIATAGL